LRDAVLTTFCTFRSEVLPECNSVDNAAHRAQPTAQRLLARRLASSRQRVLTSVVTAGLGRRCRVLVVARRRRIRIVIESVALSEGDTLALAICGTRAVSDG
jgi:hypothetical protein